MSDEIKTETVEKLETPVEVSISEGQEPEEEFDKVRAMELITKLRKEAKESEKLQKKLKQFEDAEAKRKEAEMSEIEKAQKRAEDAESRSQILERKELQRTAAISVGISLDLSDRLRGETLEELEKDAEGLKAFFPDAKSQGKLNATVPGSGGKQVTETREQKLQRLGLG